MRLSLALPLVVILFALPVSAAERDPATLAAWDAYEAVTAEIDAERATSSGRLRAAKAAADDLDAKARQLHTAYLAAQGFGDDEVDAAHDAWEAAKAAAEDARTKLEDDRRAWLAKMQEQRTRQGAALETFRAAFAASDWAAWSETDDAALLEQGLGAVARHATESDPKGAIRAWETLLARLPACRSADPARTTWLPILYPSTGDLALALTKLRALHDAVDEKWKATMLVHLGDVRALAGDVEVARTRYQEAKQAAQSDAELDRYDPRRRAERDADLRLKLIGRTAPEIASPTWFGGEAVPLSSLEGKVAVLDFWATWCQPCRSVMPKLDELHRAIEARGGVVLGVTRFYANGFLPHDAGDLHAGEPVRGMDEATYLGHLATFKARTKIGYPFVVVAPQSFKDYEITGIPTVVVVGRDGKVAYVAVGGMREALIRMAVDRALGDKSD